jgi:hypothetical protein
VEQEEEEPGEEPEPEESEEEEESEKEEEEESEEEPEEPEEEESEEEEVAYEVFDKEKLEELIPEYTNNITSEVYVYINGIQVFYQAEELEPDEGDSSDDTP